MLANLRESAAGPDGIPGIFCKRLAYWLASNLATVYQQLIHQARISDDWRQAKVIPLFIGKEDKSNPFNYRSKHGTNRLWNANCRNSLNSRRKQ